MILNFKYGFEYGGFLYGWYKKELYRLPSTIGQRHYGFKKLNPIQVGNQLGYRVKRQKLSVEQLRQRTIVINREMSLLPNEVDLP